MGFYSLFKTLQQNQKKPVTAFLDYSYLVN